MTRPAARHKAGLWSETERAGLAMAPALVLRAGGQTKEGTNAAISGNQPHWPA